jgi:hypothetical protein
MCLSPPAWRRLGLKIHLDTVAKVCHLLECDLHLRHSLRLTSLGFLLPIKAVKKFRDPRDKVFSILGLIKETVRDQFSVDYTQSIQFVYGLAVKAYIKYHQDLGILWWNMPLKDDSLWPSWCPL